MIYIYIYIYIIAIFKVIILVSAGMNKSLVFKYLLIGILVFSSYSPPQMCHIHTEYQESDFCF